MTHKLPFLTILVILCLLLIAPVIAETQPDPWDDGLKVFLPHNQSASPTIRIVNSTYLIHHDPGFPVEWFAIFVTLTFIFFLISLYVEKFGDLFSVLSTVFFFILAYQSQFLAYHYVESQVYDDYIVIVPMIEVYHIDWISWALIGFAFVSLVWTTYLFFEHFRKTTKTMDEKERGIYQDKSFSPKFEED